MNTQPTGDPPESLMPMPAHPMASNPDSFLVLVERAARDPNVDVGKMERLLEMAEKVNARRAETEYDAAMNAAQAEMRPIATDADNPQTRSRYASYGAMDRALRPIYVEHGFSLSFGTRASAIDRVTVTCRVSHRAGHTEKVEIDMPADGKGAKGNDVMTKTHATGSAVSYGMRYLLKMIFNVSIGEYDDDGNAASPKQSFSGWKPTPAPAKPAPTPPKPAPAAPKAADKAPQRDLGAYIERCKERLVAKAKSEPAMLPYWQRFAVEQGWILPNEGIEAILGNVTQTFRIDPEKDPGPQVATQFATYEAGVAAMAMPEPAEGLPHPIIEIAGHKDASANGCPNCGHKSVILSKDFEGILYCQACAWQWDLETGNYYEEHDWQGVVCPIPPKGMPKKEYDQQPMTLGQISRLDHKRWYGLVMNNQEAKGWTDREGKQRPPSKQDEEFAKACRAAVDHMAKGKEQDEHDGDNGVGIENL